MAVRRWCSTVIMTGYYAEMLRALCSDALVLRAAGTESAPVLQPGSLALLPGSAELPKKLCPIPAVSAPVVVCRPY